MAIKVEKLGDKLVITADLESPRRSASGKSLVLVSTHGNIRTNLEIDGRPVNVGLNVYTHA